MARRFDLARFGAWVQAKWDRFTEKRLTVGSFFGSAITFSAFIAVTLAPVMRAEKLKWTSPGDLWKATCLAWLALLAALYLKYSEGFKRTRLVNKLQRGRRTRRQILTGKAMKDLCVQLQASSALRRDVQGIREKILQSAALGVDELLGLPQSQQIVANLVEFIAPDFARMRVSARSSRERDNKAEYPKEDLVAWLAIKNAHIEVVDDVTSDPRWAAIGKKSYRSVAAVPIGYGGKACASLVIDSENPYAFYGRLVEIAIQLEPYAAVLALTYGQDAVYHPCQYDPANAA